MTIIAVRDGVIAADTADWHGDISIGTRQKIIRLRCGALFAGTGLADVIDECADWLNAGARPDERPSPPPDKDDFLGIVLSASKTRLVGCRFAFVDWDAPFHALGAHNEFLYGAMAHGASAEEAVRLCLQYGGFCGGNIQIESIERAADRI